MYAKRETSVSVEDLQAQVHDFSGPLSDSIKRLAISFEGTPQRQDQKHKMNLKNPNEVADRRPILTVMSNARDDFNARYEITKEIGRGGFSTVYQCRQRQSGEDFAVKVVDLRPLRLRERFNPARLKREVDIMRRLSHPNIIKFVEVYEDEDHLMMVMELCPGKELFDVILSRKVLREDEAKPIFAQIASALYYLHSLNIIHRDVKPENVLVLDKPDPLTGRPITKLLDFGLSKNAGGGSAAKTFVGTPCYLAPEVEYTSKGLGGTYGLPADCWSLGAVLYVMLVARFPEFEQDINGKVVVKLPPVLWNHISSEAKDLIRGLMNTNPAARMTAGGALMHPWLGQLRVTPEQLTAIAVSSNPLSQNLQEEEETIMDSSGPAAETQEQEITAGGNVVFHQAMVLRQSQASNRNAQFGPEQLQLAPLLHLQRSIATCFEEAHAQYEDFPEVATQVRRGAVLCRQQLVESTKMLRKVEHTATEVLNMFPDLELAIEEEEPQLASEFFNVVKGWITELREEVTNTQKINKASMNQIQRVVEQSTVDLKEQEMKNQSQASINVPMKLLESLLTRLKVADRMIENPPPVPVDGADGSPQRVVPEPPQPPPEPAAVRASSNADDGVTFDANQVLELFMSMFSAQQLSNNPRWTSGTRSPQVNILGDPADMELVSEAASRGSAAVKPSADKPAQHAPPSLVIQSVDNEDDNQNKESMAEFSNGVLVKSPKTEGALSFEPAAESPRASQRLAEALQKLRQVDIILEQLGIFWANTEVVLDLLTKKGQHVEQFIGFSSKPRLMARFRERMEEYKRFWEGVRIMCANYVAGIQTTNDRQRMYGFLEKNGLAAQSQSTTSTGMSKGSGGGGDSFDSLNGSNFFGDTSAGFLSP